MQREEGYNGILYSSIHPLDELGVARPQRAEGRATPNSMTCNSVFRLPTLLDTPAKKNSLLVPDLIR